MKLEAWLRMAKLDYKTDTSVNIDIAPKGKIPFIEYQGKLIGDSTLIIEMFKSEAGIDLDADLTPIERAISLAFRRMIKENIYWGEVYIRYQVPENWQGYQEVLFNAMSGTVSAECQAIVKEVYNIACTQLYNQGMGRHSDQEVYQIITADFQALSDFLADKPYFMGDKPTTLDATAYAYIGNLIKPPLGHAIVNYVLQLQNLCQHYERMNQLFFSDLEFGK